MFLLLARATLLIWSLNDVVELGGLCERRMIARNYKVNINICLSLSLFLSRSLEHSMKEKLVPYATITERVEY